MSKKKRVWKKTLVISLGLIVVLFTGIFVFQWKQLQRSSSFLMTPGEVDQLELRYQSHSLRLRKEQAEWKVLSWDDKELLDQRADNNFVNHLVDVMANLRRINKKSLDAKLAPQSGVVNPWLSVSVGWSKPSEGSDVVLFGDKLNHQRSLYAFLPKRVELAETSFLIVKLMEKKSVFDFRDRRITKAVADDVDDLKTSKVCQGLHLYRNGDHWVWKSKIPAAVKGFAKNEAGTSEASDRWLSALLTQHYESIDENAQKKNLMLGQASGGICEILIEGRNGLKERLVIDSNSKFLANDVLPATYRVSDRFLNLLR